MYLRMYYEILVVFFLPKWDSWAKQCLIVNLSKKKQKKLDFLDK